MKKSVFWSPLVLLLLGAFPLPAKPNKSAQTNPSSPSWTLVKIIAGIRFETDKTPKSECSINLVEQPNAAELKLWIETLAKAPTLEAYLFVPVIPSIELYAKKGEETVLIDYRASMAKYPASPDGNKPHDLVEKFRKLFDEHCQTQAAGKAKELKK